jgi:hypothetical protein
MKTDDDFRAALARERQADRAGAKAFAEACAAGDPDRLYGAVDYLNHFTCDGWRLAMKRVAKLATVSAEIRTAFLPIWIESNSLPLRVGNRRVLADGLRLLLPGGHEGESLRLYRGAGGMERRRRLYGFSWTTRLEEARGFAERYREAPDGGIVLEALAPADAILLVREDEEYYDEGEVVVDPFRLGKVAVAERLSPSTAHMLERPS